MCFFLLSQEGTPTASAKFLLEAYLKSLKNAFKMDICPFLEFTRGYGRRETPEDSLGLNGKGKGLCGLKTGPHQVVLSGQKSTFRLLQPTVTARGSGRLRTMFRFLPRLSLGPMFYHSGGMLRTHPRFGILVPISTLFNAATRTNKLRALDQNSTLLIHPS